MPSLYPCGKLAIETLPVLSMLRFSIARDPLPLTLTRQTKIRRWAYAVVPLPRHGGSIGGVRDLGRVRRRALVGQDRHRSAGFVGESRLVHLIHDLQLPSVGPAGLSAIERTCLAARDHAVTGSAERSPSTSAKPTRTNHLVIKDSAGRTMIIELPACNCVGAGSPFGSGISRTRSQFDARFTATTSFKTTSTPADPLRRRKGPGDPVDVVGQTNPRLDGSDGRTGRAVSGKPGPSARNTSITSSSSL